MILILDNGREYSDHKYCIVDIGDMDHEAIAQAISEDDELDRWWIMGRADELHDMCEVAMSFGEWWWCHWMDCRVTLHWDDEATDAENVAPLVPWLPLWREIVQGVEAITAPTGRRHIDAPSADEARRLKAAFYFVEGWA